MESKLKETTLTDQEQQTLGTFNRHVHAFRSADLAKVLDDFADDAIVITPEGVFDGKENIRSLYEGLLAEFGNIDHGDSPGIIPDALQLRDNLLLVTWHAVSKRHTFPFGVDTFLIQDDKIQRQTVAFTVETSA